MKDMEFCEDPRIFRFDCACGTCFHLAISTTIPGLFAIAETVDEALRELKAAIKSRMREFSDDITIPDFLPEDF